MTAPHGTTSRWRAGCRRRRCPCRAAHNADTTGRRRAAADEALPPRLRRQLLKLLRRGARLVDAAEELGTNQQAVWGRARRDPQWRDQLDRALTAGRDPNVEHGREYTYRLGGCRCPECRQAHRRA